MRAAALLLALALAGCTEVTILVPRCIHYDVNIETGEVIITELEEPDSACIAEFIEKTRRPG